MVEVHDFEVVTWDPEDPCAARENCVPDSSSEQNCNLELVGASLGM